MRFRCRLGFHFPKTQFRDRGPLTYEYVCGSCGELIVGDWWPDER